MTLRQLREMLQNHTDNGPTESLNATRAANMRINDALEKLLLAYPQLLRDLEISLEVPKKVVISSAESLSVCADDPWVLQTEVFNPLNNTTWPNSLQGTLVGRRITLYYGGVRRDFRIRDVWTETQQEITEVILYMALDRPWPNTTDEGITGHIWTSELMLPKEVKQIQRAWWRGSDDIHYPLELRQADRLESEVFLDPDFHTDCIRPTAMYDRPGQFLAAPNYTPETARVEDTEADPPTSEPWTGPEYTGIFAYALTYSWGSQDHWRINGAPHTQSATAHSAERLAPYVESGASLTSEKHNAGLLPEVAVRVYVPDPNIREGYADAARVRYNHCGIIVNVYRQRVSIARSAQRGLDFDSKFYFMARVDPGEEEWIDDGSIVPDPNRTLPSDGAARAVLLFPMPSEVGEFRAICTMNPKPLIDDNDSPPLPDPVCRALVHLALSSHFAAAGNNNAANRHEAIYTDAMGNYNKHQAEAVSVDAVYVVGSIPFRR